MTWRVQLTLTGRSLSRQFDRLSVALAELPCFAGLQELNSSGQGLFDVPTDLDVIEFGTESAQRYWDYVRNHQPGAQRPNTGAQRPNTGAQRPNTPAESVRLEVYLSLDDPQQALQLRQELQHRLDELKLRFPNLEIGAIEQIQARDYIDEYRKSVQPSRAGRFWIAPPWFEASVNDADIYEDSIPLIVDPGMAFGTGDHPTTQLILEYLSDYQSRYQFERILDLGCGTGILAAAARKLWPNATVVLMDTDPQCEIEVQKTWKLNALSNHGCELYFGREGRLTPQYFDLPNQNQHQELPHSAHGRGFDLVLSNIYAEVLVSLLPSIAAVTRPGAIWLSSGILQGLAANSLLLALEPSFELRSQRSRDRGLSPVETWLALECVRC